MTNGRTNESGTADRRGRENVYQIDGETLSTSEILARCGTDTNGRRLNPATVLHRLRRAGTPTFAKLREPIEVSIARAKLARQRALY